MTSTTGWRRHRRTRGPIAAMPTYRVEHREAGATRALGELSGVPARHATLEPFVSALLRDGADGEVHLVDAVTGAVVARRQVAPFRSKAGDRFRQLGD
jgi:hypothetical protein